MFSFMLASLCFAPDGVTISPSNVARSLPKLVSMIGDSRAAQQKADVTTLQSGTSWQALNVANALMGNPLKTVGNYGISGNRTDQYFASNLTTSIGDTSEIVIFWSCCVNDISQALGGYTSVSGTSITMSNVAQVAAQNAINAVTAALQAGKRVILVSEPGSSGFTSAQVAAVAEVNQRLAEFTENTPGVLLWDIRPVIWDSTTSSTAIVFKSGYSFDGTHLNSKGGYFAGKALATFLAPIVPAYQAWKAVDYQAGPNQLVSNAIFSTVTGGTHDGSGTVTGNIPSGWNVRPLSSTTSVAVSSSADSDAGNDVTLTITASAVDTIYFDFNVDSSLYSLGDVVQAGCDVSVASGSSNAYVYLSPILATTVAGSTSAPNVFALYGSIGEGAGPTEAYQWHMQTLPVAIPVGGSKAYVIHRVTIGFTGPGNFTGTFSKCGLRRRFGL